MATTAAAAAATRKVVRVINAPKQREGAGFIVRRPIGGALDTFDPFLMLDEFGPVDYRPGEAKGAPWHPHRGFQTVSYILEGGFEHQDSLGFRGSLGPGDMQWMVAGSGVVHDETPKKEVLEKGGRMHGFQLWVNLPREKKMMPPDYQDVGHDKIATVVEQDGAVKVKVLAGEYGGVKSHTNSVWPVQYLHIKIAKGHAVTHVLPADHNAGVYVFGGKGVFGSEQQAGQDGQFLVLSNGGMVSLAAAADSDVELLFLSGKPINEPIARHGPFVMNTDEEIQQAFQDYQSGRFARSTPTVRVLK
eukprot:TRINITY_DN1616_c2_g1_i3.p2 TRINITY_DN1616_c2_g1~~TRINITY_DN1616_c2_g1_i3.p2  ORF type:complete len:303 (+),score=59.08 TRINITY_DN1616_c2_g1_i3:34-942(+)